MGRVRYANEGIGDHNDMKGHRLEKVFGGVGCNDYMIVATRVRGGGEKKCQGREEEES